VASKTNRTTIPTCTQDTITQREMAELTCLHKVGAQVNWPVGERIPQTLEDALELGWEITGSEGTGADEYEETGEAHLKKTVGALCLSFSIPYRATIEYGEPHTPKARIITETRCFAIDGKSVVELPSNSSGQGMVN
jgi:hypothetical protein